MARRKQEEQDPPGIVVLYTSLMILLLAFFILLNTLGKTEEAKVDAAFHSLMGSFGFQPGGLSPLKGVGDDSTSTVSAPINPVDRVYLSLRGLVKELGYQKDIRLLRSGTMRSIEMPDQLLFEPGSTKLTEPARDFLFQMAELVRGHAYPITIKGHTDDGPSLKPGMSNWVVSANRALAVAQFLVDQGVAPSRLAPVGMAGYDPMVVNDTPHHRRMNNRVALIFDARDTAFHRLPEVKQRRRLDFKGFTFDLLGIDPNKKPAGEER